MFTTKELLAGLECIIQYTRHSYRRMEERGQNGEIVRETLDKASEVLFDYAKMNEEVSIVNRNAGIQVCVDMEAEGYDIAINIRTVIDNTRILKRDRLFIILDSDEVTIADYR